MGEVAYAEAAPQQRADAAIEAFRTAIVGAADEVIGDLVHPIAQGLQNPSKPRRSRGGGMGTPLLEPGLAFLAGLDRAVLEQLAQRRAMIAQGRQGGERFLNCSSLGCSSVDRFSSLAQP